MLKLLLKPFYWGKLFTLLLTAATALALLDNFVFTKLGTSGTVIFVPSTSSSISSTSSSSSVSSSSMSSTSSISYPIISELSYQDEQISITIETLRRYNTNVHVADVYVNDVTYLKSALAFDTFGRNYYQKTSEMAEDHNAIFAVNGDYYGFRDYGFVLRNGVLYRSVPRSKGADEAILLDSSGNFNIIHEQNTSEAMLSQMNVWQIWSFGPGLISNGTLLVDSSSEVPNEMNSNPRTAIGQISSNHFLIIVSDGRTTTNAGLSLLQLASVFQELGATIAYNLDGGGSSTMWFNGKLINYPVNHGSTLSERSISDIIYVGY